MIKCSEVQLSLVRWACAREWTREEAQRVVRECEGARHPGMRRSTALNVGDLRRLSIIYLIDITMLLFCNGIEYIWFICDREAPPGLPHARGSKCPHGRRTEVRLGVRYRNGAN
jgi:hypothetical protein